MPYPGGRPKKASGIMAMSRKRPGNAAEDFSCLPAGLSSAWGCPSKRIAFKSSRQVLFAVVKMAELMVEIPEELAKEAKHLGKEELNLLISEALRERLPERLMLRLAGRIRGKSLLTDGQIRLLASELKERVAKRHGL